MASPQVIESAIEALDDYLLSDDSPDDCMLLSDLDGFLTGVAVGPEIIAPSEWLPVIWGGDEEPVFSDAAEAQTILGAVIARYNEILDRVAEGEFEPIFLETDEGEIVATDWAEGFAQAINMRIDAWGGLFKSESHAQFLLPILALCCDDDGQPLVPMSEEDELRLLEDASDLIPECVVEIAGFWRSSRAAR